MKRVEDIERTITDIKVTTRADTDERILAAAGEALDKAIDARAAQPRSAWEIARMIMTSNWTKYGIGP